MQYELDAPANDVIAMNLTAAALDRWLANVPACDDGEEVGKQIGAMYREIRSASAHSRSVEQLPTWRTM